MRRSRDRHEVLLLQGVLGDYRVEFVRQLRCVLDLDVVCGDKYFDPTLATDFRNFPFAIRCRNIYLVRRRLMIQVGSTRKAVRSTVLVAEGNPRILSTWLIVVLRRILRKPTILWAHAWSRRGAESWTNHLRVSLFKLSNAMIVYTPQQKAELDDRLNGRKPVFVAANSLYTSDQMVASHGATRHTFVYSGRMVEAKRPGLLVEAFMSAKDLPQIAELVMIGDGPELAPLRALTHSERRVRWLGQVTDPSHLAELYGSAVAAVSPGYAGLSVTQSVGFGVPIVVADDEPHAPEIALVVDGFNGRFFEARNLDQLQKTLLDVWAERQDWCRRADAIAENAKEHYSVEAMAAGFLSAVEFAGRLAG